ncbi:hypothetical protein R80B4_02582 [Fibrobacteres bacterium R8-0-B4]
METEMYGKADNAEALGGLEPTVRAELDRLKELIVGAVPGWVERIYLFGSYAYGTPRKDSDLDLYVVLKDDIPLRNFDAGLQIQMAVDRRRSADTMPMDIVAKKREDFENRLGGITLERKVVRDGVLIYG